MNSDKQYDANVSDIPVDAAKSYLIIEGEFLKWWIISWWIAIFLTVFCGLCCYCCCLKKLKPNL